MCCIIFYSFWNSLKFKCIFNWILCTIMIICEYWNIKAQSHSIISSIKWKNGDETGHWLKAFHPVTNIQQKSWEHPFSLNRYQKQKLILNFPNYNGISSRMACLLNMEYCLLVCCTCVDGQLDKKNILSLLMGHYSTPEWQLKSQ